MNVKFLQGTQDKYDSLTEYDQGTFYFTGSKVYLGNILLSNEGELTEALNQIKDNEEAIQALENLIGNLENLNTTAKDTIVNAINEIYNAIGTGDVNAVVSIEEGTSDDYAKVYTVYQGNNTIGIINIPKDLVVESGEVEEDPEGHQPGTYIVLTLANTDNQKIYINVADLVNIYTGAEDAEKIQIHVIGTEISASIIPGSIETEDIDDGAITTAKIADGNVTSTKLSITVQEELEKANSSIQNITTGTTNGTIMVDGMEVSVAGLGSAAYTHSNDYDSAGSADQALTNAKDYADSLLVWEEM